MIFLTLMVNRQSSYMILLLCWQDTDFQLEITSCIKVEGGKFIIEEPLDRLFFCISWILLLQPHNSSDRPSDGAWPCFGFSLSQENEVLLHQEWFYFYVNRAWS